MTGAARSAQSAPPAPASALVAEVAARGSVWFPELRPGPLRVRWRGRRVRSRCLLFRLELCDGRLVRPVVVKVRHSDPALRRPDRFAQRPVLAPVRTLPDAATARREYDGLFLIRTALRGHGGDDPRFGALRPLVCLPEHAAIVTDFVDQPTLRTALLATSRLHLRHAEPMPDGPWENAGAWLRLFHDQRTDLPLTTRAGTPAEVAELFGRFTEFLVARFPDRAVLHELHRSGADLVRATLPPDLPLATGHGDFVANNMFVSNRGRITVFDPLPMWRVPVYQDLATITVGLRMLSPHVLTGGLAFPAGQLDRYEAALCRGYFGDHRVPRTALAVFQLLVLLDRWSSLASRRSRRGGVRPQLRQARIRVFSRHCEAEARRLSRQLVG